VSLSSLKITSRTLFKVKIRNKIRCAQLGEKGNEVAKRCVFRRRLKVPSVSDAVTLDGKVFQARGTVTKNARSPIVVRHEDGVTVVVCVPSCVAVCVAAMQIHAYATVELQLN